jgi:hypothetical protein
MFVTCRKKVKFTANNGTVWKMKPGFIGDVPAWVVKHWYFDKLCKDGSITAIVSKKDKDVQDAIEGKENGGAGIGAGTPPPVIPPVTGGASTPPASNGEPPKSDGDETPKGDGEPPKEDAPPVNDPPKEETVKIAGGKGKGSK